jgi:hypothetical protein
MNPVLGRFTSEDPIGFGESHRIAALTSQIPKTQFLTNTTAYIFGLSPLRGNYSFRADFNLGRFVENSPANLIDPLGLAASRGPSGGGSPLADYAAIVEHLSLQSVRITVYSLQSGEYVITYFCGSKFILDKLMLVVRTFGRVEIINLP